MCLFVFFFFKQKTAYEMRISDWSSDVCSSDLRPEAAQAYREYIESQGFDTKGIERPILIRRRVTEMDDATLRNFITGSNSDTKQELSAPERDRKSDV